MDSIAFLVSYTYRTDGIGQRVPESEVLRKIWVTAMSVTRSEFFSAGSTGLTPELVLKTAAVNYSGEKELIYGDVRYSVYRVYRSGNSDEIELYINKKAGAGR